MAASAPMSRANWLAPAPMPSWPGPPCSRAARWKATRRIFPRSATRRRWRAARRFNLEHDVIRWNRHHALALCLSMISAQTRSAFVARENRFPLFRIMLLSHAARHEAADRQAEITVDRPDHGAADPIWFRDHGIVGYLD